MDTRYTSWKPITIGSLVLLCGIVILGFALSCGEKNRAASKNSTSNEKPVATAPATDPRVIIAGFQDLLKPEGVPLTDKQQERIMEVFDSASPYDMRPVFGVLIPEQKRVFVNKSSKQLEKSKYPLTKSQESRIMAIGPGSKDKSWLEIFTPEQIQIMGGAVKTSSQTSTEKKSELPQKNIMPEIQITLLENGEYDIDGRHATAETFEEVLKAELGTYPKDYRRLLITGTPKNKSQLDLATTIAHKLKAAVGVKLQER